MEQIIQKIKEAKLVGRGGAGFPTATKWEMTKKAKGTPKYVICNASEGELGVFKDFYILDKFTEDVFKGMALAMDYLDTKEAWFNLNADYYKKLKRKIDTAINKYANKGYKFTIFEEHPSYIGGEETALLDAMEGKRCQPRMKPPFPGDSGLFGKPTLVNNVETFFNVSKVSDGFYKPKRFYAVSGPVKTPGVYHLANDLAIYEILKQTGNIPSFKWFAQIGGSASGLVINPEQAKTIKMTGAGSLEVYRASISPKAMLSRWFKFYAHESCGKCTPCREGSYQLYQLIKKNKNVPWKKIMDIIELMERASFCALGKSIGIPVKSYMRNILKLQD